LRPERKRQEYPGTQSDETAYRRNDQHKQACGRYRANPDHRVLTQTCRARADSKRECPQVAFSQSGECKSGEEQ
jgi:hypothetical protein